MKVSFELDLNELFTNLLELMSKFRIEHFLLLYLAIHMLQIAFPSDGSMIFDEAHYVPASLDTLQGIAANAEHPPLPKIIAALGIAFFGNTWFGWRFPQVLMQIAALYLFYLIAKRFLGDRWALGATMLLGFDTVFFIHGGALLIDMPSFLFGFLAIELYFRKRYSWSAVSMGLTFLSREMSIFTFITLAAYHLAVNRKKFRVAMKLGLRYTLLALLVFGSLLWVYDLSYRPPTATYVTNVLSQNVLVDTNGVPISTVTTIVQVTSYDEIWNPIQHVLFIYHYHGPEGIVLETPYEPYDSAWNWILPTDPFNSPTYYGISVLESTANGVQEYSPILYVAQANLALWYGIWPAIAGVLVAFWRRKEWLTALFAGVGIASNFLPWLVISLLTRRIGFNYYMIYTLPYVALGLVFTWRMLPPRIGKIMLAANLLASLAFFIWFFPVHPAP